MIRLILFTLFTLLTIAAFAQKEFVTVAVAANAQYAMKEIKAKYEQQTGQKINLIIGSSGKLTAQIKEGAPFDIFLAADLEYPNALHKGGFTQAQPRIYGYGELVLWTLKNIKPLNLDALLLPQVKAVAIANPKLAPYGEAALHVLKYHKLYEKVKPRLVYGESISQLSQYIGSGAADLGFTAKSVVLSPELQGKGSWVALDPKSYTPIAQGAVLLKKAEGRNRAGAEKFYNYLFSDQAKAIFGKYGYRFAHE
jgi:molybdate transport system substrate-binding protein